MLSMWNKRVIEKIKVNNAGSFTIEATFIMVILIGIIMAMLYVSLYCFDRINVGCEAIINVKSESPEKNYIGQLGRGELSKKKELNYFYSEYKLDYNIPIRFLLSENYVNNQFSNFRVLIRVCNKKASDTTWMYDAIKSEE